MKPSLSMMSAVALAAVIGGVVSQPASAAREHLKSGALSCDISAGLGVIVGSQKQVSCLFTPARPGPQEAYVGTIAKFGLDLGATSGGQMIWEVRAPTAHRFGALSGEYAGASAQANGGARAGVNVLVGGSDRTVTLQPVSVDSQSAVNVAAGVTELRLRPAR